MAAKSGRAKIGTKTSGRAGRWASPTIPTVPRSESAASTLSDCLPRGVGSFQIPPWTYVTPDFDLPALPPTCFEQAVRQLLRHWSYRGIEPTVKALGLS